MLSNASARKSFDSLSPTSPTAVRGDFVFHGKGSSGQHGHARRGSTASSIHSVGGSLDTSTARPVFEYGQNAISTLLQPPIVRTGLLPHTSAPTSSAHKPPTARDIPPVTLTSIPHVDAAEFRPYLSQVGSLYEQLRRVRESEEEATNAPHRRSSKQDDAMDVPRRPSAPRRSSTNMTSPLEAPSPVRRTSSGYQRRPVAQGPPPLSTIPNVYFDEDFHLENPRPFDIVSERSEVVRPSQANSDGQDGANGHAVAPRKALSTNAILQEKLSWYMDTVEMHLVQSISTASTTFFTALGALRELHSEAAESVGKIKALRTELHNLDAEIATTGLTIVQHRRRRENLQQLHNAVLQLGRIVDSLAASEALAEAGENEKSLDSIDRLEKLIAGEAEADSAGAELLDLRGASALQGVNEDLDVLRLRIGRSYESKFMGALMGDIRRHGEDVSTQEVLMRWSSASMRARGSHGREPSAFPTYMSSTESLRAELLPILTGLHRARHLSAAAAAYREAILRQIRNIIRRPLPSSSDDDNESIMSSSTMTGGRQLSQQEKSSILARNLRALDAGDAEALLVTIYVGVTETLRRVTTQVKVLLDVASSIRDETAAPLSPPGRKQSVAGMEAQEEIHKSLDMSNLLGQAVDVAQDKIVKLLRVRTEQSVHAALGWFLRYFTLNLHFATECESISGRSGKTLNTVVNGQIKEFVSIHGDVEKQQLAQGMESDLWDPRDFDEADQGVLDQILAGSTRDAPAWAEGSKVWIPHGGDDGDDDTSGRARKDEAAAAAAANGTAPRAKTRSAVIESESFVLPQPALLCMRGIGRFLHLMAGIPSMTSDIAASLASYLQLFNSRCTQLILGAGATRSAGLKNINTKHLALASQALAFVAAMVPHVRECVRRHCGSGVSASAVTGDFDKIRRLFQEHQNSIYDKLVDIMSGRAAAAAKKMRAVDWEAAPAADTTAHAYMETVCKETTTLHRTLTKNLPDGTVRSIMMPVFTNYRETFGGALHDIQPRTEAGRDSLLRDIDFFQGKLGKMDGFGDTADQLRSIVKAKVIESVEAVVGASEAEDKPEPAEPAGKADEAPAPETENGEPAAEATSAAL